MTTEQTTAQTTTSFLDNLRGIQPQREITPREKSSLDWLLEIEEYVVGEYNKKDLSVWDEINEVYMKLYEVYVELHKDLSEKLKDIKYSEQDLEMLIHTKANNDYKKKQSQALGLYTGVLLHMLTERNRKKNKRTKEEGKKTTFYINGRGNRFDYLFFFAKQVDELIVENFTGKHICSFVGSFEGNAKIVIINNVTGDYAGWWIGSYKGNAGTVIINNVKGNYTGKWIGSFEGNAGTVVINNVKGYSAGGWIGSYQGNVGTVVISNVEGSNIEGDWAGYGIGSNKRNVKQVLYNNVSNLAKNDINCGRLIPLENAGEKKKKLIEMIELANNLNSKNCEEILTICQSIKN